MELKKNFFVEYGNVVEYGIKTFFLNAAFYRVFSRFFRLTIRPNYVAFVKNSSNFCVQILVNFAKVC